MSGLVRQQACLIRPAEAREEPEQETQGRGQGNKELNTKEINRVKEN